MMDTDPKFMTAAAETSGATERGNTPTPGTAQLVPPGSSDQKKIDRALEIEDTRMRRGYILGTVGILGILIFLLMSFGVLRNFSDPGLGREFKDVSALRWAYIFAFVKEGLTATVAVAGIWFFYQLVRAAERMALPWHWMQSHPETARLVLGVQDPARVILRAIREMRHVASDSLDKTTELVGKITGAAAGKKGPPE